MKITLRQLRYFVALADTRSFGLAAARVNISQPALSLQIKEIETSLGTLLVERLPRDIRLTRAGEDVLARARVILAQVHDLEQAVRWQDGLSGELRLGVIPTVAPYVLTQLLARLHREEPQLEIRVREALTERLIEGVVNGRLDAAIMALPVEDARLVATPLCEDRFLLAGTEGRIAALGRGVERLRPKQIDPDHLLLLDEGHCLADQALEVCGLKGRGQLDMGASSLATLCGLVEGGFGLTFMPELAAHSETSGKRIELLRFAAPEPSRSLVLVRRKSSSDAGWVEGLAAHIREACAFELARCRKDICPERPT